MSRRSSLVIGAALLFIPSAASPRPPRISGNFERGSRYAVPYDEIGLPSAWAVLPEEFEQETWAYEYNKGYFQVAQRVNPLFRYSARLSWNSKDFPWQEPELNNKNTMWYYRAYCWLTFSRELALRLEYYIRDQRYEIRDWDNMTHVPSMQLRWDIDRERKRRANLFLRYNTQRFAEEEESWKDKNQISARVNYQEEVFGNLLLKAQYSYVFRRYRDNPDRSSAVRRAVSTGFEYQF